jgi:hypothetical protein
MQCTCGCAAHGSKRRRGRRTLGIGIAAAVVSVALGGVGYAYWSGSGTGSGTIRSTTAAPLTVASLASPLADLFPGKTDDLGFTVTNPNGYRVSLTTLSAVSVTSSDSLNCPSSHIQLSLAAGATLATPINVPAGSSATGTLPGLVTMSVNAPDGCQGKTFTVNLSFSGSQY